MTHDLSLLMNPTDEAALLANPELGRRGRNRLQELMGDVPIVGTFGLPHKKGQLGECRVCGSVANLSFEHMPPQSSGNKFPGRAVNTFRALEEAPGEFPPNDWINQQRGAGAYVTCVSCNSFSGNKYVKSYSDLAASVIDSLTTALQDVADAKLLQQAELTLKDAPTGDVIRQALFMLVAVSGGTGLITKYPELRKIINGEVLPLPADLRVRLALVISRRSRLHSLTAEFNPATDSERCITEIAFTPFAWLLEVGDPSDRESADVSEWTSHAPGTRRDISFTTVLGDIVNPFPGDYRYIFEIVENEQPK